jgi:hypothetical protein
MREPRSTAGSAATVVVLVATLIVALVATTVAAQTLIPQKEGQLKEAKPSPVAQAKASAKVDLEGQAAVEDALVPHDILAGADETMWMALMGWSSKYRIGLHVNDGDWVKYRSFKGPVTEIVEIRASKTEDGNTWIIEKHTPEGAQVGTEMHLLYAAGQPRVLEAFTIDEKGDKLAYEIPDPMTAAELMVAAHDDAVERLGGKGNFRVVDCPELEEKTGAFGTLNCRCLEVRVAAPISPLSLATVRPWVPEGTLLWMSRDVPRLIPMPAIILPALVAPDDTMVVPGGMVLAPYYELLDYSGRQ